MTNPALRLSDWAARAEPQSSSVTSRALGAIPSSAGHKTDALTLAERQYARHMEPGNLESRVTALEHQVRDLSGRVQASEQDAAAARVLAGAADRDVGALSGELRDFRADTRDFRADTAANFDALRASTTASFNALREDFVDLRDHVDRGFSEIRGKLDATAAGQQQIVDLLQSFTRNPGSEADE